MQPYVEKSKAEKLLNKQVELRLFCLLYNDNLIIRLNSHCVSVHSYFTFGIVVCLFAILFDS